jgi:GNAT superfamily N-acetyltransferase
VTVPNSPAFALRPMTIADSELAYAITREAMREYVEQTWGAWIEAEQCERHARSFRAGQHDFIVVNGIDMGLRALEWRPGCVYLARLYLRTAAQGQGIGAAVLRDLLAQARVAGRGVELQVLKVNTGAQRFYTWHGFERVGSDSNQSKLSLGRGGRGVMCSRGLCVGCQGVKGPTRDMVRHNLGGFEQAPLAPRPEPLSYLTG